MNISTYFESEGNIGTVIRDLESSIERELDSAPNIFEKKKICLLDLLARYPSAEEALSLTGIHANRNLELGLKSLEPRKIKRIKKLIGCCRKILLFISNHEKEINQIRSLRKENQKAYEKLIDTCSSRQREVVKFLTDFNGKVSDRYRKYLEEELTESEESCSISRGNQEMKFLGYTNSFLAEMEQMQVSSKKEEKSEKNSSLSREKKEHHLTRHSKIYQERKTEEPKEDYPISCSGNGMIFVGYTNSFLGKSAFGEEESIDEIDNDEKLDDDASLSLQSDINIPMKEISASDSSASSFQRADTVVLVPHYKLTPYTAEELEKLGKSSIDQIDRATGIRMQLMKKLYLFISEARPEDRFQMLLVFISKFQVKKEEVRCLVYNLEKLKLQEGADYPTQYSEIGYTSSGRAYLFPQHVDSKKAAGNQKVGIIPYYDELLESDPLRKQMDDFLLRVGKDVSARKAALAGRGFGEY